MTKYTVKVPTKLVFKNSIEFAKQLNSIGKYDEIEFDFSRLNTIDPFSLLFISSEMQRCISRLKDSNFRVIHYEHCTYPAHMGFFRAFGVEYGKTPGQAKGSSTYIPINIFNTEEIIKNAQERMINPAEFLESRAREIAGILTQGDNGDLNDVLIYCLREIFRNVIEHSEAKQFGFCAQYLPSFNRVSFSIIDRGVGLKDSLSANPTLNLRNDEDAILAALSPGVSGKIYKGLKRKPKGEWANSGYGLFMTSNICKLGGGFFIASGERGYYLSENIERFLDTPFVGTALNLALDTTRIKTLNVMLQEIDNSGLDSKSKPSKSAMGLINRDNSVD